MVSHQGDHRCRKGTSKFTTPLVCLYVCTANEFWSFPLGFHEGNWTLICSPQRAVSVAGTSPMQSAMFPWPYMTGTLILQCGARTNISIQVLAVSAVFLSMTSGNPIKRHSTRFFAPSCYKNAGLELYHTLGMQGGGDTTPSRDF